MSLSDIEQERLDGLTDYKRVLAGITNTEIYVIASDMIFYRMNIRFNGHDGSWYIADYNEAKDGTITITSKYKDRKRVFITPEAIEDSWILKRTIEIAKLRAVEHNDTVNTKAYFDIKRFLCIDSTHNDIKIIGTHQHSYEKLKARVRKNNEN